MTRKTHPNLDVCFDLLQTGTHAQDVDTVTPEQYQHSHHKSDFTNV